MKAVLLDTHAWIWSLTAAHRLTDTVRTAIATAHAVHVSPISLLEVAQKVRTGKWPEMRPRLAALAADDQTRSAPFSRSVALLAGSMDWAHRDPFDRIEAQRGARGRGQWRSEAKSRHRGRTGPAGEDERAPPKAERKSPGLERTTMTNTDLRRDQEAHARQLQKVEEISLCFRMVDKARQAEDEEAVRELKSRLMKRFDHVLWKGHGIPAMRPVLGTADDAQAAKDQAREEGHSVIHVFPLDARPETHGIEITLWLTHSGDMSTAAVMRRMYRLETLRNGTEVAVETAEPLVRSVIWRQGETEDCDALEPPTAEVLRATLDQIKTKDPVLGSAEGV